MKTLNNERYEYVSPMIERVQLDNEISLALESAPPSGPDEGIGFNQNNPFRDEIDLV